MKGKEDQDHDPTARGSAEGDPRGEDEWQQGKGDPWQTASFVAVEERMSKIETTLTQLTEFLKGQKPQVPTSTSQVPMAAAGEDYIPKLAPIDRKHVERPEKYSGDIKKFIVWSEKFIGFLQAQDPRWRALLTTIETWGHVEFKTEDYYKAATQSGVGPLLEDFKQQLYQYLHTYTTGSAAGTVLTLGAEQSFETWRRFADRGRSRRPEHQHRLHTDVLQPTTATSLSTLDTAITTWEYNLTYWIRLNPTENKMSDTQRRLILINLCPKALHEFFLKEGKRFTTYEEVKYEINDWVARECGPKGVNGALPAGGLNAVAPGRAEDETFTEEDEDLAEVEKFMTGDLERDNFTLMALVKNLNNKFKSGKGGKGGKSKGKCRRHAR